MNWPTGAGFAVPVRSVVSSISCKRFSRVGRNRPTRVSVLHGCPANCQALSCSARRGSTRGRQPSCGGSRRTMRASAFGWPRSVLPAWGEPARPGFPRRGKRERGAFQFLAAAGICFIVPIWPRQAVRPFPSTGSGPPGCDRPRSSESGSAPASNVGSCPTWRSHCATPGTTASSPPPRWETIRAS